MSFSVQKKLTVSVIAEAETIIAEERHRPKIEWREPRSGFAIRFNKFSGSFLFRQENRTITLGAVGELSAQAARHLAEQARSAVRDGRDPVGYVRVYKERLAVGDDPNSAHARATEASARSGGLVSRKDIWRVQQLIDDFVAYKIGNDLKEGRWPKQLQRLLEDEALNLIRDKRVCDVTPGDLFSIKRALVPEIGKASSRGARIVRLVVAMFDYAQSEQAILCGLLGRDPFWRMLSVNYSAKKRRRAPRPNELARMLLAVKRHASLGDGVVTASQTLQTLLYFVFATGQRDGAASALRRKNVIGYDGLDGWRIAHFDASDMKGRRGEAVAHAVPLAPPVVRALEQLWAEVDPEGASEFVFPAARGGGHVAATGLNGLCRALSGKAGDARPPVKEDYEGQAWAETATTPDRRRSGLVRDLLEGLAAARG